MSPGELRSHEAHSAIDVTVHSTKSAYSSVQRPSEPGVGGAAVGGASVGGTRVGGTNVGGTGVGGAFVGGASVGGNSVGGASVGVSMPQLLQSLNSSSFSLQMAVASPVQQSRLSSYHSSNSAHLRPEAMPGVLLSHELH